jgi:hypothetical protein
MLSQVTNFLKKNKKIMYYLSFFTIIYFILWDSAFASEATKTSWAEAALTVVEWLLKWVSAILAILTYLVTLFLDPSWVNGSFFGLTEKFRTIWIMVSNVVYFIFAVLLVWIAFMNIIWKEGDKYQLKQALPKFVVWVLIVPFSWFIVQAVLSISAVLTVSAITLPYDTFSDYQTRVNEIDVKNNCTINIWGLIWATKDAADTTIAWDKKNQVLTCDDSTTKFKNIFDWWWDANSTIFATVSTYTFWILKIDRLDDLDFNEIKATIRTVADVVIKVVIDFLFVLIYAILMIALWLVLMIRGIYLWLYIMFSPLFWLMYFFDKNGSWEWFFEKFNFKEFFALAMVPVYSMLALSFGLLFMYVVWTWMTSGDDAIELKATNGGADSEFLLWKWWSNEFSLKVKGSLGAWWKEVLNDVWSLFADTGTGSLWVIWTLIIQFFWIVVLWWTIMAAMRSSSITKAIVEPIHQFGTQVWSIMAKAPQNVPIFWGQSMKSMGNVAQKVWGHIESKNLDRANDFASKHMKFLDADTMNNIANVKKIWTNLDSISAIWPELSTEWKKFLGTVGTVEKWGSIKDYQDILQKFWNIKGIDLKELKNINTAGGFHKAVNDIESKIDARDKTLWAFKWTSVAGIYDQKREDMNKGMQELATNWTATTSNTSANNEKIAAISKNNGDTNYYDISIWNDSVAQVSEWDIIKIPWLDNIETQIKSLTDKLWGLYKGDIKNKDKLKEFITAETKISNTGQLETIAQWIQQKRKEDAVTEEGDAE